MAETRQQNFIAQMPFISNKQFFNHLPKEHLLLTLTTSVCPPAQAYMRGVLPEEDWALTSALCAINNLTISTCPADAPSIRGVQSPLMPLSSTLARMARSTWWWRKGVRYRYFPFLGNYQKKRMHDAKQVLELYKKIKEKINILVGSITGYLSH